MLSCLCFIVLYYVTLRYVMFHSILFNYILLYYFVVYIVVLYNILNFHIFRKVKHFTTSLHAFSCMENEHPIAITITVLSHINRKRKPQS